MSKQIRTIDIRGQLVFLGTGTSVGVPAVGCGCDVCGSDDPKNQRTRSSIIVGLPDGNLLVDTSPDLRFQLLREGIGVIHSVAYTHDQADHLMGMDDLRLFPFYLGHPVPLYCEDFVENRIRRTFDYAFTGKPTHAGGVPQVEFRRITTDPFQTLSSQVIPIRLKHGRFNVLGFRFGDIAYCTDTNEIPAESWPLLADLDLLILGALRARPHPTHFSLQEAVEVVKRVQPKRALFTHICHELEHESTCAQLPANIDLAYDGMRVSLV